MNAFFKLGAHKVSWLLAWQEARIFMSKEDPFGGLSIVEGSMKDKAIGCFVKRHTRRSDLQTRLLHYKCKKETKAFLGS